jgi:hypothetical protein
MNRELFFKNVRNTLCKTGFHNWKPVKRAYSWNWFFGTQWVDTGRRICKHCRHEKMVGVEYAMLEGEME